MKYRVAIFRRINGRLVFDKFAYSGYAIIPNGDLVHAGKVCNTTDKRRKRYYEINVMLPKPDRLGQDLYQHDIVFDSKYGAMSIIWWSKSGCAFVLATKHKNMTVKYRYCDFRDSVEKIGNEYETTLNQITARGMTK